MGESDPHYCYKVHHQSMSHHQEMILAVKDQIKPGIFSCKAYTLEMLLQYFHILKTKKVFGK